MTLNIATRFSKVAGDMQHSVLYIPNIVPGHKNYCRQETWSRKITIAQKVQIEYYTTLM